MFTFTVGLLCFSAVFAQTENHNVDQTPKKIDKVAVDVYYESLCPDSIKFITKQLYPALGTELGNYVNLTLHPFGKSTASVNMNGEYIFNCHHGNEECDGNKYHACAVTLIDDGRPTQGFGYNKVALDYVNCLLSKVSNKMVHHDQCASDAKDFAAKIATCATGKEGDVLLHKFGNETDKFQLPLRSVPTITFNAKDDEEESKAAYNNFRAALCKKFGEVQPAECSRSGAYSTQATLGVLSIIVALLFL